MRLWRAVSRTRHALRRPGARDDHGAVTALRNTTAVATSTPWLKAMRAATWLAPIISAISSRVAKPQAGSGAGASPPAAISRCAAAR